MVTEYIAKVFGFPPESLYLIFDGHCVAPDTTLDDLSADGCSITRVPTLHWTTFPHNSKYPPHKPFSELMAEAEVLLNPPRPPPPKEDTSCCAVM
jgi:hypothetical protein